MQRTAARGRTPCGILGGVLSRDGSSEIDPEQDFIKRQVRALIETLTVSPAAEGRGVTIEMTGELTGILALAFGQPLPASMYGNNGAGEGIRTLDPNLGKIGLSLLSGTDAYLDLR